MWKRISELPTWGKWVLGLAIFLILFGNVGLQALPGLVVVYFTVKGILALREWYIHSNSPAANFIVNVAAAASAIALAKAAMRDRHK